MTIKKLDHILDTIRYYDVFKNLIHQKYPNINYGKRIGTLTFNSLFEANEKFTYNSNYKIEEMKNWSKIFNSENASEEQLFILCLKIFDWGKVYTGNIKKVIELYEQKRLKQYLNYISKLLESKTTIEIKDTTQEILWTSGWTKVYSFINSEILIYDSRVSSFINYSLIKSYNHLNDKEKTEFHKLSKLLFNFGGATNRARTVPKEYGFINQHPKGVKGFNANLISSWIVQLTKSKLNLKDREIREFERSFFMLGFDLQQLNKST